MDEDDEVDSVLLRRTYLGNILGALGSLRRRRHLDLSNTGDEHRVRQHSSSGQQGATSRGPPLGIGRTEEAVALCNDFQEDRLKFEVAFSDGGEFSGQYSASNILRNDTSCYCSTRKSNANVILRFAPENLLHQPFSFTLTHAIVKAPISGFTSPVKDVLIFVSQEYPKIDDSKRFDGMTHAGFLKLMEKRKRESSGLQPDDPAAFISLGRDKPCVVEELHPPRTGKFVLVKFLTSEGFEENIDCQFVGFQGFSGKRAFAEQSIR